MLQLNAMGDLAAGGSGGESERVIYMALIGVVK